MTKTTAAATASARRGTSHRLARANPRLAPRASGAAPARAKAGGTPHRLARANPRLVPRASGAATGANPLANSRSSQSLMRASFQMPEPPLQRLVGAIEARRHRPHRAPHHTGDL